MQTNYTVQPLKGILKMRSRGEFVLLLQKILKAERYILNPDGFFDKQTQDAVIDFQGKNSLKQDGIVGSKTWMLLNSVARAKNISPPPITKESPVGVLKIGKKGEMVLLMQENLIRLGFDLIPDGNFGSGTERVLRQFQNQSGLTADGICGPTTWLAIGNKLSAKVAVADKPPVSAISETINKLLSENDLMNFAQRYGLDVATVKAVHEVESSGRGFKNDKVKILFEGHIFWRELEKRGLRPAALQAGNENIIYKSWIRKFYNEDQHARLEKAQQIHNEAALSSASYGLFQIMGFHAPSLGFESAADFVNFMNINEANQLEVFGRFIKKNDLIKYLKEKDWAGFAKRYNGPGYKQNKYDTKMANAYHKYVNMGID